MTKHITCPACQAECEWITEDLPDGVYHETCPTCWNIFSYKIKNGNYEPYPPAVNQSWKGKGEAGGKNDK